MTYREMNLAVFSGDPIPHPLYQPRIEPWFEWHRIFGKLPDRYRRSTVRDLYDDLDISMRYVDYYTDMPHPIERELSSKVTVRSEVAGDAMTVAYETPHGELVERHTRTVDSTWREIDFPVKKREDFPKLRWLFQNLEYSFNEAKFLTGSEYMGDRGEPQFYVPKSPYLALAQQWMKLDTLIYALADYPEDVKDLMDVIDASYDRLYEEMVSSGLVNIINFGENLHDQLLSPRYFEEYLLPFYHKRTAQLKKAGIYSHMHLDGTFRSLLPYLKALPFDGLEALTPAPQGDVSIEEIREHIGEKILLDGIPAIFFLPSYPEDALMSTVEQIVSLFHPRLVLGISDEIPEGADPQGIERVRKIAAWCRKRKAE